MNRDRLISMAGFAGAVVALSAAAQLTPRIQAQRAELQLTANLDVLQNLPPDIAFTQAALGSFRGLAVDYLWIRASSLESEGKYYEANQLSRWITKLQPRFPQVWSFHAWNMAYNISEAVHTPEEKWMWVSDGIRLLRDEGIPLNPQNVQLHRELAYFFFHRIGKYSVEAQAYFKTEFAREWDVLLGAPLDGAPAGALAAFRPIAFAPLTLEELRQSDPRIEVEIKRLSETGFPLDLSLLQRIRALEAVRSWTGGRIPERFSASANDRRLMEWLDDSSAATARGALLAFVRSRILRETYRMDPAFMYELWETYGPLDWRHPAAHTVYWGSRGARQSERALTPDSYEVLQIDRLLLHGLQALAFNGKIIWDPITEYYSQAPEPRLFDAYEKVLLDAGRRQKSGGETPEHLRESHRGFLMWAVQSAYLYGGKERATAYYARLRKEYGANTQYDQALEDFIFTELTKNLKQIENVRPVVLGLCSRAITEGWANGHAALAKRLFELADRIHRAYQNIQDKDAALTEAQRQALALPLFPDMVADALSQYLLTSPQGIHPLIKARVWRRASDELKQRVFDRVQKPLHEEARRFGLDPAIAFPEPPGMSEYRKTRPVRDAKDPETELHPERK